MRVSRSAPLSRGLMMSAIRPSWPWLLANVAGIALFLALAMRTWVDPELRDVPGASGPQFAHWATTALPIFLLFIAVHIVLGLSAAKEVVARHGGRGIMVLAVTLCCWVVAFVFDNAHHGS